MNKDLQNALESIGNAKIYYYDMEGQQESTIKSVYNVEYQILENNIEHLQQENQKLKECAKTHWNAVYECIELKSLNDGLKSICDKTRKQNEKLKKVIELLKDYVAISKRKNEKFEYIPCIYSFGLNKDISQQEYELLKEVL